MLATGGIGKAYKITSNSWEYTGDGHTLAYDAGAELIDMEFVQFHPTGMIWPPSVRGILVTEGVRGEGGVLRNSKGERFMFGDIPDNYKPQTAENEEEGFRYVLGEKYQGKDSRRPPELLTRDHVARCIVREVREGRGSPHGGVFLELQTFAEWFGKRSKRLQGRGALEEKAAEHVSPVQGTRRARHHQASRWKSARRRTTSWAACASIAIRRCRASPDCSRAANVRRASTAPTGSAAIRCRTCSCSASEPANSRRSLPASKQRLGAIHDDQVEAAARWALEPFERNGAKASFQIQADLQDMMQDLVGIVRKEDEMMRRLKA